LPIEILKHTPPWVFVLFSVLLALGYLQSRDRTVTRGMVAVLPVAMTALSFYGVVSAFGVAPVGFMCWLAGVIIALPLGVNIAGPRGVSFATESRSFSVPGSWLPLALMMAIFFTKYAVGVVHGLRLAIAGEPAFVGAISLCYGLLSGIFVARAIAIWRSAAHTAVASSAPFTDPPQAARR
jgi:hypothetical protein